MSATAQVDVSVMGADAPIDASYMTIALKMCQEHRNFKEWSITFCLEDVKDGPWPYHTWFDGVELADLMSTEVSTIVTFEFYRRSRFPGKSATVIGTAQAELPGDAQHFQRPYAHVPLPVELTSKRKGSHTPSRPPTLAALFGFRPSAATLLAWNRHAYGFPNMGRLYHALQLDPRYFHPGHPAPPAFHFTLDYRPAETADIAIYTTEPNSTLHVELAVPTCAMNTTTVARRSVPHGKRIKGLETLYFEEVVLENAFHRALPHVQIKAYEKVLPVRHIELGAVLQGYGWPAGHGLPRWESRRWPQLTSCTWLDAQARKIYLAVGDGSILALCYPPSSPASSDADTISIEVAVLAAADADRMFDLLAPGWTRTDHTYANVRDEAGQFHIRRKLVVEGVPLSTPPKDIQLVSCSVRPVTNGVVPLGSMLTLWWPQLPTTAAVGAVVSA